MEKENFNTDLFIDEIEKRPSIWDMTSSDYSNKILRRRAWEELVLIFCEGDENDEKKKLLASSLQKKWKSLRDNFIREAKKFKNVKSGSGASKNSTYIHFNRLQFLTASVMSNDTESSFDAINDTSLEMANSESSSTFKSPVAPRNKKKKLNPADEKFANILEKSLAQSSASKPREEDDEDKLFSLSIYKEIKKIPESKRLKTKIDIYNLIMQNQTAHQQPQYQPQEILNYYNPFPQRRNFLSQEQQQRSQIPGFQYHDYRSQQSSTPNNCDNYGYSSIRGISSPGTPAPIPSPAPTNGSNESEIDLFSDN